MCLDYSENTVYTVDQVAISADKHVHGIRSISNKWYQYTFSKITHVNKLYTHEISI